MPSLVIFVHMVFADAEARNKALGKVINVAKYAQEHEPDARRFAICLPRDDSNETSLYALEEYASKAALDAHMASQPVTELLNYYGDSPPQMTFSVSETSSSFVRPEINQASDPFICHASIVYKPGKRDEALEGWQTVTSETQQNEPETLGYTIMKDQQDESVIQSFEVYSSQQYFKEVHVPSKAVQDNVKRYGNEIRVSLTHTLLKLEGGYLHKS